MKTILLVDSSQARRQVTEIILSNMYGTICAATGIDAAEIFREIRPDLVLSQFRLSDMTGVELFRELQSEFGEMIPFVLTGSDDVESEAVRSGVCDFVREPFAPEILICRIEKVLAFVEKLAAV